MGIWRGLKLRRHFGERFWRFSLLAVVITSATASCSKPPEALANMRPEQVEALQRRPPEASTTPSAERFETSLQTPTPKTSTTPAALFANPAANDAAREYAAALNEARQYSTKVPPPTGAQVIRDPASAAGYLNGIGTKIRALHQAQTQVEANLDPEEKARWEAFRKSIQ
jgi:hypothetical protein